MAKYKFTCKKCLITEELIVSSSKTHTSCIKCGELTYREFPNLGSKKVTETVDSFLNIRNEEDQKKQLEDRRTEYFWRVEVPRFVESGTYSIETMLAEGWVMYNEKNELVLGKLKKSS